MRRDKAKGITIT